MPARRRSPTRAPGSRASTCPTASSRARSSASASTLPPTPRTSPTWTGGAARRGRRRAARAARRPRQRRRRARTRAPFLEMTPEHWDQHARGQHARHASSSRRPAPATSCRSASPAASSSSRRSSAGSVVRPNNTAYSASKAAIDPGGALPRARARAARDHRQHDLARLDGDRDARRRPGARRRRVDHPRQRGRVAARDPARHASPSPPTRRRSRSFSRATGARHITGQDLAVDGGQTTV